MWKYQKCVLLSDTNHAWHLSLIAAFIFINYKLSGMCNIVQATHIFVDKDQTTHEAFNFIGENGLMTKQNFLIIYG